MTPDEYVVQTWTNKKKFCYFLIQGTDIKKNSIILGDAFLRGYYVYHDVTNKRVGMFGDYMLYYGSNKNEMYIWIGIAAAILVGFLCYVC